MTASGTTGLWGRTEQQDFRSRVRGCLLGGAIGDALGAGIEFHSLAQIQDSYGSAGVTDLVPAYGRRGAITDDTQMTLFTVDGLIRAHVRRTPAPGIHPPTFTRRTCGGRRHNASGALTSAGRRTAGWPVRSGSTPNVPPETPV